MLHCITVNDMLSQFAANGSQSDLYVSLEKNKEKGHKTLCFIVYTFAQKSFVSGFSPNLAYWVVSLLSVLLQERPESLRLKQWQKVLEDSRYFQLPCLNKCMQPLCRLFVVYRCFNSTVRYHYQIDCFTMFFIALLHVSFIFYCAQLQKAAQHKS